MNNAFQAIIFALMSALYIYFGLTADLTHPNVSTADVAALSFVCAFSVCGVLYNLIKLLK